MADEQYVVELRVDLSGNIGQQISTQLSAANNQFAGFDANIAKVQRGLDGTSQSSQKLGQGLSQTRYALYDVSQTLGILGAGLIAIPTAIYAVAIAWERNFANVIRTTGASGDQIQKLRDDFMDLASTIPISSAELAKIGTLAGQLGIKLGSVANFTETVAKFAAVTDVTAEKAATSFGRINSLIPGVNGNFEALGSAVAKVGVNSVATEGEILAVTTQLSSMSRYAGLSAEATIGLAGALSSVGVPPELSRGTITRLFTLMGRAVADGGDRLKGFAQVAGVSAQEFSSSFGGKFDETFLKFVNGLDNISKSGGDTVATLNSLGITAARDVPTLTKLAQAANSSGEAGKLLNQTMQDAKSGFSEATALSSQYAVINSTVAAKLELVRNNVENLFVAIGQGGGIFGGLLDVLNDTLRVLTDLSKNPVTNFFLQLGVILTGIVGVLTVLAAGAVAVLGGLAAMTTALVGLQAGAGGASVSLGSLTAIMASTGAVGRTAAAGINLLGTAIKGLGFVGILGAVATGFFALSNAVIGFAQDSFYAGQGAESTGQKVEALARKLKDTGIVTDSLAQKNKETTASFQSMGASFNTGVDSGGQYLKMLSDLATESGDAGVAVGIVSDAARLTGVSFEQLIGKLPEVKRLLDEQDLTLEKNASGIYEVRNATGELVNQEEVHKQQLQATADALGLSSEQMSEFAKNIENTSSGFINYSAIIDSTAGSAKGFAEAQAEAAGLGKGAWASFVDSSAVNLDDFSNKLNLQIQNQQTWASNVAAIAGMGATNFASELARMGPEGAAVAAAAVNATSEQLMRLEEQARLAAFLSSSAFTQQFTSDIPMLTEAYQQGGVAAVQALISAQVSRAPGAVEQVISQYNLNLSQRPMRFQATDQDARNTVNHFTGYVYQQRPKAQVDANTNPAEISTQRWANWARSIRVGIPVTPIFTSSGGTNGQGPLLWRAEGGYISGPGTSTSDSIPARLSNGEYVVRASAVSKYGIGYLNALNQGKVRQYASGGMVSGGSSSGGNSSPTVAMGGVVELGPRTLNRMNGMGSSQVDVHLDDVALSRRVQRGNEARRRNGELI